MRTKLLVLAVPLLLLAGACGVAARSSTGSAAAPHRDSVVTGLAPNAVTGGSAASGAASVAAPPAQAPAPVPPLPSGQHLELAATVAIQMAHGKFTDGLNALLGLAATEHGYLASSNTSAPAGGTPESGTFTFEIPADNYQDTLNQLRQVGRFMGQQTSSKPHDTEYVDLQARLQSANLQLAALNGLLGRATSIGDIIAIEQQIAPVQQEIEQIKGQLQYLDSLTQYATITVNLSEKGAAPAPQPLPDGWGFGASLQQAVHNLAAVLNVLIVVGGTLLPFVLLAAMAFATRRRWLPVLARS